MTKVTTRRSRRLELLDREKNSLTPSKLKMEEVGDRDLINESDIGISIKQEGKLTIIVTS